MECRAEKVITVEGSSYTLKLVFECPLTPYVGLVLYGLRNQSEIGEELSTDDILDVGFDVAANQVLISFDDEDASDPANRFFNWSLKDLKFEFHDWTWESK